MLSSLNVEMIDLPFDPTDPKKEVRVRSGESGKQLYQVYLFLAGSDLAFVERVTYHLHPTFSPSVLTVERSPSNPTCQLVLWLWGTFEVKATVEDGKRNKYPLRHMLTFDRYFEESRFREEGLRVAR